jgi:hypothetical protein
VPTKTFHSIESLRSSASPLPLKDIGELTGIDKSTALRFPTHLENERYVTGDSGLAAGHPKNGHGIGKIPAAASRRPVQHGARAHDPAAISALVTGAMSTTTISSKPNAQMRCTGLTARPLSADW